MFSAEITSMHTFFSAGGKDLVLSYIGKESWMRGSREAKIKFRAGACKGSRSLQFQVEPLELCTRWRGNSAFPIPLEPRSPEKMSRKLEELVLLTEKNGADSNLKLNR